MEKTVRKYIEILSEAIGRQPAEKHCITIAIDGRCASGKTTLANALSEALGGNLFHMDDFFLPKEMRTPERLSQPGGNVHYERFADEVLAGLASGKPFDYGVFDCSVMAVTRRVQVQPQCVNLIEGSYSTHPYFGKAYDLTVFLSVPPDEQERRIRLRGGDGAWAAFRDRWIPLEEKYFSACAVRERADIILD
ncbi:MAG: hypothetical protein E7559_04755 [Ruminococcaceae bacterium]|nr:hypothetical protein [Oscillospiraceae bacterium]